MRSLMGCHGTRGREIDDFLIAGVFVNLFTIVKQSLCIGEPKYSIKNIEHLYMNGRIGQVATALESVVQYHRWLLEQDGTDWTTSKILAAIRAYNKDDCDSIVKLANWLRQIQSEHGITWIPKPPRPEGESDAAIDRQRALFL